MANFATTLKQEVQRIARKEARAHAQPLQQALAQAKSRIRTLVARVDTLERQLKAARRGSHAAPAAEPEATGDDAALRFRAGGFASHRKRLGLSAAQAGKILGVSPLSVYKWESGKAHPRRAQLVKIAELRQMGKREAQARLENAA